MANLTLAILLLQEKLGVGSFCTKVSAEDNDGETDAKKNRSFGEGPPAIFREKFPSETRISATHRAAAVICQTTVPTGNMQLGFNIHNG